MPRHKLRKQKFKDQTFYFKKSVQTLGTGPSPKRSKRDFEWQMCLHSGSVSKSRIPSRNSQQICGNQEQEETHGDAPGQGWIEKNDNSWFCSIRDFNSKMPLSKGPPQLKKA